MRSTHVANNPEALFSAAEAAFRSSEWVRARADLATLRSMLPKHPMVLHLSALVEKGAGDADQAARLFEKALSATPDDAQILNNYGNLRGERGEHHAALALYDRAVVAAPGWAEAAFNRALTLAALGEIDRARAAFAELEAGAGALARFWSARGALELADGDLPRAAACYDAALSRDPSHVKALHGRACVAIEREEPDAVTRFVAARRASPDDRELALGHAQALLAADHRAGEAALDALVASDPVWSEALRVRADLRWQMGERETFLADVEHALTMAPDRAEIHELAVILNGGVSRHEEAADAAARAVARAVDTPRFLLLEAVHAGAAGDWARAEARFIRLRGTAANDPAAEARHWLRADEVSRAATLLDEARANDPGDISAWALTDLAWRLLGDSRHEWLHGAPGLIGFRALTLSGAEIETIRDWLRGLHRTRAFPIGQSMRGGTQTRGKLLAKTDPEATILRNAIETAVAEHWRGLPALDDAHPLLASRDSTPRLAGSWSVRLSGGGFHVAHIHPRGLLSSAAYFATPEISDAGAGDLEIGRPPNDLGIDLPPLAQMSPKLGWLALFPSTLMHGTRPFPAGERMTVAFDIVGGAAAR